VKRSGGSAIAPPVHSPIVGVDAEAMANFDFNHFIDEL
jgi:hypothetical protein